MSLTATDAARGPAPAVGRRPHSRFVSAVPTGLGLALMGGLLALRSVWAVDLALVCLWLTVPGLLALRAGRVSVESVNGYPVYVVAASLVVILTGGLITDLLGPSVGIAAPLHGLWTAYTVVGLTVLLWAAALLSPQPATVNWRPLLSRPSLLAPMVLPALAGAGALLLSNGRGDSIALIGAALTAAVLVGCVTFAHRLSRAHVVMILFACALAAEWAFSIRSQEIVGFDISTEIHVAQHTQAAGIWHATSANNAYSAMLSLTVLPSVLAALTGLSPLISFKVLYPALAALLPLTAFFIAERVVRRNFAVAAAALIIAQSYFFELMPQLARQEIGLLFFAALAVALLDRTLRGPSRLLLVAALSLGLVVSHYSSAYLAIPVLVIALTLQAIIARPRGLPALSVPLLCAVVFLIGGAGLWYGAITRSTSNLVSFTSALNKNGLDLVPAGGRNVVSSYLNGNTVQHASAARFQQLAVEDYKGRSYVKTLPQASQARYQLTDASVPTPRVRVPVVATLVRVVATVCEQLMLLLGVLGGLLMTLRRNSSPVTRTVGLLALSTVAVLAVLRFSGTAAQAYNQPRALLQSLVLLAVPAAWLGDILMRRLGRIRLPVGGALLAGLLILFVSQSSLAAAAIGGARLLDLSQRGEDYERFYTTPAELAAARWATDQSRGQPLYADRYGQLRLSASTGRVALTDLTPQTLARYSWVYGTRTNVVLGRARGQVGNYQAIYAWPGKFLDDYFNTVYSNGDSKVYHR